MLFINARLIEYCQYCRSMINTSRTKILVIINVVGIAIIAALVFTVRPSSSQKDSINLPVPPSDESAFTVSATGTPVSIIISSIGVNAKVEQVGKTESGRMAVPRLLANVGWYKLGAYPGEIGNVVIAGHLDNAKGKPAVFFRLSELKVGDSIDVIGATGIIFTYQVTGMKIVPYDDPGTEVITDTFGKTAKARLNLITCDGTWVQAKKSYTDRLIVNSELIKTTLPEI